MDSNCLIFSAAFSPWIYCKKQCRQTELQVSYLHTGCQCLVMHLQTPNRGRSIRATLVPAQQTSFMTAPDFALVKIVGHLRSNGAGIIRQDCAGEALSGARGKFHSLLGLSESSRSCPRRPLLEEKSVPSCFFVFFLRGILAPGRCKAAAAHKTGLTDAHIVAPAKH